MWCIWPKFPLYANWFLCQIRSLKIHLGAWFLCRVQIRNVPHVMLDFSYTIHPSHGRVSSNASNQHSHCTHLFTDIPEKISSLHKINKQLMDQNFRHLSQALALECWGDFYIPKTGGIKGMCTYDDVSNRMTWGIFCTLNTNLNFLKCIRLIAVYYTDT